MRYAIVIKKAQNNYSAYVPNLPFPEATSLCDSLILQANSSVLAYRRNERRLSP
ncbi:MAG: type II toxin-antitoxin system HicB family antitoxin [Calothrix sp. C42_A2020_038]|nr:type II toxin-antitoxin system HicB family antitoxin [Calothrix sp. C42_A2020_038]